MHDRIDLPGAKQVIEKHLIAKASLKEITAWKQFPVPGGKIIQGDGPVALLKQFGHHVRADIPGSANDKDGLRIKRLRRIGLVKHGDLR